MKRAVEAVKNPRHTVTEFRLKISRFRAKVRKFQLHDRTERFACAERLAPILGERPETLREYHREVCTNPVLQPTLFDRFSELHRTVGLRSNTSTIDAETMYVLCRAFKPDTVIETGVLYGSYDAYILAALDENDKGQLHSIDLPGQPNDQFEYGHLIPEAYRERWNLHLGNARDILADVCNDNPPDVFLHDSLHTKNHMRWEYEMAYDYLPDGGILASHDVLYSDAFQTFAEENDMPWARIRSTGVAVK